MKKKLVLVFAALLTSAAALSLILATSRYVAFLTHPESVQRAYWTRVEPSETEVSGLNIRVAPVSGETEGVSPLLVSTFWIFDVSVVNDAEAPADVDFDRLTLEVGGKEIRALTLEAVLRLFNERMTGAYTATAGRRGHQEVLDQLQDRKFGVTRVFPGYSRNSLVFFQIHPDQPQAATLRMYGVRWAGKDPVAPLSFQVGRG